ncbi:MAG: hypothetical protein HY329_28625 [Chloroflexi bacterium]|nr:hypothetical protein [Chloroflexota bacterium]
MTATGNDALRSATYDVADELEAVELFQRNGWTDGLPVVPPTEERVRACLERVRLGPDDAVGVEPVRRRRITAEKVAINAVMAGCLPEHLRVVLAIVEAVCEPQFNLHGSTASTGGSAVLVVVNGPIRRALRMNGTDNVLANGNRANAAIGRAIRLIIMNVLGGIPGQLNRSTIGHPGKFTYCFAEDEEGSPWTSLAQERGVPPGASAVTVMAAGAPHQVMNAWTRNPKEICETFAAAIRANMLTYSIWAGNYALVIPRQLFEVIASAGWQKRDIRDFVYRSARVRRRDWATVGKANIAFKKDPDRVYTALPSPDDLMVVAAGGPAGAFSAIIPPWIGNKSMAVTKIVP